MDLTITIPDAQLDALAERIADKLLDLSPGLIESAPLAPDESVDGPVDTLLEEGGQHGQDDQDDHQGGR